VGSAASILRAVSNISDQFGVQRTFFLRYRAAPDEAGIRGATEEQAMASTATERTDQVLRRERQAAGAGAASRDSQAATATTRYHAIDALRGAAMFLVISLHAALG
jgi:hypothetical protein